MKMKLIKLLLILLFSLNLQAQDLTSFMKENQSLPCFGDSKPVRIAKNVKFVNLSEAIPKYYSSITCLVSGNSENIMGFFKIPENLQFLFDRNVFAPDVESGSNESISQALGTGKTIPVLLSLQMPSDMNVESIKEVAKSTMSVSRATEELGKLGSMVGKKKGKNLPYPLPDLKTTTDSNSKKRPIFLNYKLTETIGENQIHLKSERKERHVNYFELQITFQNNPGSSFQIVHFLLLSDLDLYDSNPINHTKNKKKNSKMKEEAELQMTKVLFENIPKHLSQQMKIQNKLNGNP
jgi:hypothetical protein